MKKLITVALIATLYSCTLTSSNDFEKGKKMLTDLGYTQIENTGSVFWCCSDEDSFKTGFKALDKEGNTIKGCLCSSFGKGVTIRYK